MYNESEFENIKDKTEEIIEIVTKTFTEIKIICGESFEDFCYSEKGINFNRIITVEIAGNN